jgi:UDP-N-acetylglucosamine 2-epimerase (non-hydrolysing)
VIAALDESFEHILVHTGQNHDYELNEVFFQQLEIRKPDHFLNAAGASAAETIAAVINKTDQVIQAVSPDAFLVLGDTNSALGAISAKKRKVPIFHMEAGNRSFDQRVPEETNRKIVDHISDINLTYSEIGRDYLLREGLPPDRVIRTGSPMKEVIDFYRSKWSQSDILDRLDLRASEFFVLSAHREENVDSKAGLTAIIEVLEALRKWFPDKKVIFSVHPRTRKRLTEHGLDLPVNTIETKPLGFLDYLKLQSSAYLVLSDSGTITEEASILGFNAVNLREAHERPEGMEEASVPLTGINASIVIAAIKMLSRQSSAGYRPSLVADYDINNVSEKVVRIILSYTHYVNRFVWRKQ